MSTTIRSILLAYDGSEMSKRAAAVAAEIAGRMSASLEAVHVWQVPQPVYAMEAGPPVVPEAANDMRQAAEDLLVEARTLLPAMSDVKETLLEGAPGPTIVGYAKRTECDLIVLGHRGLNGFERFFLGSISEYVLRHAHCPVMIVKE